MEFYDGKLRDADGMAKETSRPWSKHKVVTSRDVFLNTVEGLQGAELLK